MIVGLIRCAAMPKPSLEQSLAGCLLGTAVGDSIGLPFENLSRRSVAKLARGPLRQSLLFGRGLISDDTEHTQMVALSLLEAGPDVALFRRRLASRLRWWLLAGPPGVGSATARSILKLWAGASPASSGVFSAGNGPAMRAAIIGVVWGADPERLVEMVRASSCLTHSDPKAFEAALAVAVAAHCARSEEFTAPAAALAAWVAAYRAVSPNPAVLAAEIDLLREACAQQWSLQAVADRLGCAKGVSGYALHTVPAALYAWVLHAGDLRQAVTDIIRCGGDTDSTAAIVGGIAGAGLGPDAVPADWLAHLWAWPRNVAWNKAAALSLARAGGQAVSVSSAQRMREWAWLPFNLARNVAMLAVVLVVYFVRLGRIAMAR